MTTEGTTTYRTTKTLLYNGDLRTSRLRSNRFVELSIQTVKNTFKKAQSSDYNSYMVLLCLHTTPVDSVILSPAELLYKRKIQRNIPVHIKNNVHLKDQVHTCMEERQADQKVFHDKRAWDQAPLIPGQTVCVQATGQDCGPRLKPRSYGSRHPKESP